MKALYVIIFILTSFVANAQSRWSIGGEFSMWRNDDTKNVRIKIAPTLLYDISSKFDLGINVSYMLSQTDDTTNPKSEDFTVSVSPFLRHYLFTDNRLRIFCDYTAGYGYDGKASTRNGFELGIKPGIDYALTDHLKIMSRIGFLGYRQDFCGLESGYGFKLNSEDISIGLIIHY